MGDEIRTPHDPPASASDSGLASTLRWLGPIGAVRGDDGRFTRLQVWLKVAVILVYIVIGTVWLPSYLMEPLSLAVIRDLYKGLMPGSTWDAVQSVIVSGVWLVMLGLAFFGMRKAQKHRLI